MMEKRTVNLQVKEMSKKKKMSCTTANQGTFLDQLFVLHHSFQWAFQVVKKKTRLLMKET